MPRQASNPYSTGGGGNIFETRVQASFVILMLAGGFVPGLGSCWPIKKIKLQGKHAGFETDDLIVFTQNLDSSEGKKLLGQIKHAISLTEGDEVFAEVIHAAWNDFNNIDLFNKEKDIFALITGPLSATDTNDARTLLEWARQQENAQEFFKNVHRGRFSSKTKVQKLNAFKTHLNKANKDTELSNDAVWDFLRHFHLLGYDLDIKAGVTLSLLNSLIGQKSEKNPQDLWSQILNEVQTTNQNAGTITLESLSGELVSAFREDAKETIAEDLVRVSSEPEEVGWDQKPFAPQLALANILGSWDERSDADKKIIQELTNQDFDEWIKIIREILNG